MSMTPSCYSGSQGPEFAGASGSEFSPLTAGLRGEVWAVRPERSSHFEGSRKRVGVELRRRFWIPRGVIFLLCPLAVRCACALAFRRLAKSLSNWKHQSLAPGRGRRRSNPVAGLHFAIVNPISGSYRALKGQLGGRVDTGYTGDSASCWWCASMRALIALPADTSGRSAFPRALAGVESGITKRHQGLE
jgi:hypothetical protein